MRKLIFPIAAALAVAGWTTPSRADVYSDFGSWSAAVSGVQTVTIPDPNPSPFTLFGLSAGTSVTYSGVTFTQETDGFFYDLSPEFYSIPGPVLTSEAFVNGSILISLPSATTAIGFNYGNASDLTVTLSNGFSVTNSESSVGFNGYNTPDFFGITDNTPFDSVLISNVNYYDLTIDNVAYAASPTPEPSYLLLLAPMLCGLFLVRRRRIAVRTRGAA